LAALNRIPKLRTDKWRSAASSEWHCSTNKQIKWNYQKSKFILRIIVR
jgi:hypothetical protein